MRRSSPALRAVVVVAFVIQLIPLAGPLLISTDAWTYWEYGRIAAVHDGDPYVDTPSEFPDDPAYDKAGARLARDDVGVRARVHARSPKASRSSPAPRRRRRHGSSRCSRRSACWPARCSRRGSRAPSRYAAALVGWNPLFAIHFAGGGHNDSILIALTLGALALAASGRKQLAGAAWALAVLIKWVPLVFFGLRAVAARAARRPVGHAGFAVVGRCDHRARDHPVRPRLGAVGRPARPQRGRAVELRAAASARAARRAARAHVRAHGRGARSGSPVARPRSGTRPGPARARRAACCSRRRPG